MGIMQEDFTSQSSLKFQWSSVSNYPWSVSNQRIESTNQRKPSTTSTSEVTFTMPEDGFVNITFGVSSEANFDRLIATYYESVTGSPISTLVNISGEVTRDISFESSKGTHKIRLSYSKDGSRDSGSDTAWVSSLALTYSSYEVSNLKLSTTKAHLDPIKLTTDLLNEDTVKYQILVDGSKVYPKSSEWSSEITTPYSISHDIEVSDLPIKNDIPVILRITHIDTGVVKDYPLTFDRVNTPPSITLLSSEDNVHLSNLLLTCTITDEDKDLVSYQIELNDSVLVKWTSYEPSPLSFAYSIMNYKLVNGENKITLKASDGISTSSQTLLVTKSNYDPVVSNLTLSGPVVRAELSDQDNDRLQYRILVNGVKSFPPDSDWSKYLKSPHTVLYTIPNDQYVGSTCEVILECTDEAGGYVSDTVYSEVYPVGLLFQDELGQYYSTEFGDLINYLDTGPIVAGDSSSSYKVILFNTTGHKVSNVKLTANLDSMDSSTSAVLLSSSDDFTVESSTLTISGDIDILGKAEFYVKVTSKVTATKGGIFSITVEGDPTN
ncbi:hypothetical protein LIS04_84 [Listeria phage LIS04]|nr:hypothetical protein LIS04_84 [Listeria phage LIS04]